MTYMKKLHSVVEEGAMMGPDCDSDCHLTAWEVFSKPLHAPSLIPLEIQLQ